MSLHGSENVYEISNSLIFSIIFFYTLD